MSASLFLRPSSIVEVGREPLKLRVMNSISGVDFGDAYARRQIVRLDDMDVPFISYQDLVANMCATGRTRDRADVEELQRRRAES